MEEVSSADVERRPLLNVIGEATAGGGNISRTPSYQSMASSVNDDGNIAFAGSINSTVSGKRSQEDFVKNRKPFHVNRSDYHDHDVHTQATHHRNKYYSRLDQHRTHLVIPDHIIPADLFNLFPSIIVGEQSSIVTIFALWNCMLGASLLSTPWAIQQAGFVFAIPLLLAMSALTFYTAYIIVNVAAELSKEIEIFEFADICKVYLGKAGEWCSVIFSLGALAGALMVYWVLLSNFMYNIVDFIHTRATGDTSNVDPFTDAYCKDYTPNCTQHTNLFDNLVSDVTSNHSSSNSGPTYETIWNMKTVPYYWIIILFPLANIKSPTFFTKFNSLGVISVFYMVIFCIIKAVAWGVNYSATPCTYTPVPAFQWTFPSFTGTMCLAFFTHNTVLSIMRNQKYPEHNTRDLGIAYILGAVTYCIVGILFYLCFPLLKSCIAQNILDNFYSGDILATWARLFIMFQLFTAMPLNAYVFRIQLLHFVFNNIYPSWIHVMVLNVFVVVVCVLIAIFMPEVGTIVKFTGAFGGLAYITTLPALVYMFHRRKQGQLRWYSVVIHCLIISFGVLNFLAQFPWPFLN